MAITAQDVYDLAPYARTLGVRFTDLGGQQVRAQLAFDPALSTVGGGLHGGALMGLADVAGAVCAVLNAAPGAAPATTQFLRRCACAVRGAPTPTPAPCTSAAPASSSSVDVRDTEERLCVRVTQTVAVRGGAAS